MMLRIGFLVAVILGLGMMFGWFGRSSVRDIHMLAGMVTLVGAWLLALGGTGEGGGARWAAALLLLGGSVLGILLMLGSGFSGINTVHWVIMLVSVALGEMGGARLARG